MNGEKNSGGIHRGMHESRAKREHAASIYFVEHEIRNYTNNNNNSGNDREVQCRGDWLIDSSRVRRRSISRFYLSIVFS